MRIYLDTVILNKIVNHAWDPKCKDAESFDRIWKLIPTDSFRVSQKTLEEINNTGEEQEEHKYKVLKIYENMKKISLPNSLSYSGGLVKFGGASSTQDIVLTKLINLLYSESEYYKRKVLSVIQITEGRKRGKMITNDAFHVYYAYTGGCDFFLTIDRKLIKRYIRHKPEVDSIIFPMKIGDPQALLNILISTN